MKVLISAYACEPGEGSEPGAGWEWSRAAALEHEVWVLTRKNNAPAIERALANEPHLRLHPVYIDLPAWARFWKRGQRGVHLYYLLWQVLAWYRAKKLHREIRFDVAHHLTFAVDWLPAGIAWVKGLPLVWGPVGGATGTPWRMWRWLGWRGLLSEALREVTTRPLRKVIGDAIARQAALVVGQNPDVARRFARVARVVTEPNVVISPAQSGSKELRQRNGVKRAVFAGRLIPWKGLPIAIEAIAMAPGWTLDVYGDGPDRTRGERIARGLGVADRVRFHGQQPREAVLKALRQSAALVHPSMHEAAGWVVAEAVATGTPVLCLDRGGPPFIIAGAAGIAVRADANAVTALGRQLVKLSHQDSSSPEGNQRCRWTADRLPALLKRWYATASGARGYDRKG